MSSNQSRLPLLVLAYRHYVDDQDSAAFVRQVSCYYTTGTLQRLAENSRSQVRRAAILALGLVGDYRVNSTMGSALVDKDRTVRTFAENGIRSVWARPGDPRQRKQLSVIVRMNAARQYDEAAAKATALIEAAPDLAEAWNQRAMARFQLGYFAEAIRDCHQTLKINPYHFVAATNMGQAYLELQNRVSALESFRRALQLNPDLEGVRAQVVCLARMVEDK